MIGINQKTAPPLGRNALPSLNGKTRPPLDRRTVLELNRPGGGAGYVREAGTPVRAPAGPAVPPPPQAPAVKPVPPLARPLRKGQKTPLQFQDPRSRRLRACFGWNVKDSRCDIDASAFLVDASGRVPDDGWFVFYGQTGSPDGSVTFSEDPGGMDREVIQVDLERLDPSIQKIVFVLTINEAFAQGLDFSMLRDVYVRLLDGASDRELLSYRLEEYFETVTSITVGELYLYNGQWKFNPVGNGLHQDLAGQCAVYGVEIC